jgi:hypothetical protein
MLTDKEKSQLFTALFWVNIGVWILVGNAISRIF